MNSLLDWIDLERDLKAQLARVNHEIWDYPAPIPACDAQYNYLLEARRQVRRELANMATAREGGQQTAQDFAARSSIIDTAKIN